LLGTVLLTLFLSFGRNLPFLSDIFFNYFPLYNKFRAVESILAVASLCFPILALLAVQEVIENPDKKAITKKLYIAGGIVGGLTLILIAVPTVFLSFKTDNHTDMVNYLAQALKNDTTTANEVGKAVIADRMSLERADAIRTFIFLLITFGLLWAFITNKIKAQLLSIILFALVLVDLWQIDKRYLKESSFQDKVEAAQVVTPREVDTFIMKDTDPDFRVFDAGADFRSDTFNPFFHKSVSGYSAARLKRFEELYLNQFTKSINQDVLDMLNTKYIITTDEKTNSARLQNNQTACGHAWFIKSVKYVKDADEEMLAISSFSPKEEAMVDQQYKSIAEAKPLGIDTNATINLVKYTPDHLTYQSSSATNQVAIFSEIYYKKGWKMLIDGAEQPYFRADYLLRAANYPYR
jgi:hypothetical protein